MTSSLCKYSSRLRQAVRFVEGVSPEGGRVLRMRLGDREIGAVHMNPSRINQVKLTEDLDPQFRGMGLGKKLYGEAARRYGVRRGDQLVFVSDSIVSQDAQRVWNSLLRRHGGVQNPWVGRIESPATVPQGKPGTRQVSQSVLGGGTVLSPAGPAFTAYYPARAAHPSNPSITASPSASERAAARIQQILPLSPHMRERAASFVHQLPAPLVERVRNSPVGSWASRILRSGNT